jgi:molecular chaperone HtpG
MGNLPESYNLVVNTDHSLVKKVLEDKQKKIGKKLTELTDKLNPVREEKEKIDKTNEKKKDEEVPQADKDKLVELNKDMSEIEAKKKELLQDYGKKNKIVKQMVDLALLSNNMLKGEALTTFVKRSVELIK